MCNHYEKNVDVIEWAARLFEIEKPNWVLNDAGEIVPPDDLAALPPDTWPKSKAPIVLQTARGRSIGLLRWGVQVPIEGATKTLTKFVTNARDDKLSRAMLGVSRWPSAAA